MAEESWNVGNLENLSFYEDEREIAPDDDDDEGNPEDFDDVRFMISITILFWLLLY